jgi:hypothetical protein
MVATVCRMEHWHIAMLHVSKGNSGHRYFTVRQVEIDYPSAEAAGQVFEEILKTEFPSLSAEFRHKLALDHLARPGMSTDPGTADLIGNHYTILKCAHTGDGCITTANDWGTRKQERWTALGM